MRNNEIDKAIKVLRTWMKHKNIELTEQDSHDIIDILQNTYDNGYENGLADGKEITENPISG